MLGPNETTVGTEIRVSHRAPTPEGSTVRVRATIVGREGRFISLQLEAFDEVDQIGVAEHQRAVVDTERYAARLASKLPRYAGWRVPDCMSSLFRIAESRDEGIARIILGAPGELNIFQNADRYELGDAIQSLGEQQWLRVLIIEVRQRARVLGRSRRARVPGHDTSLDVASLRSPSAPERIPQPVIAAIDGHCYGGPFELSLACDFRIVAETASLGLPEVTLGQMPGSGGGQRLLRLIGLTRAKDLA